MLLTAGGHTTGSAQETPTTKRQPASQLGVWIGGAFHSRFDTRLGTPAYRNFYVVGVRRTWEVAATSRVAFDYTIDVIPLAVTTRVPQYHVVTPPPCTGVCPLPALTAPNVTWHTAFGFGAAPVGMQARLFPSQPIQGFLGGSAGVLWFTRRIPDPEAARLNFTAQIGGGVQMRITSHQQVVIGYQYHHTSNAGIGRVNPGLNSHVLYLGLARAR